jgi:PAS domain S-box-containing protein
MDADAFQRLQNENDILKRRLDEMAVRARGYIADDDDIFSDTTSLAEDEENKINPRFDGPAPDLPQSGWLLRTLLANSDDGIAVLDLNGRVAYMNERGRRALDVNDADVERRLPLHELWKAGDAKAVAAAVASARSGRAARFQAKTAIGDGSARIFEVKVDPVLGTTAEPETIVIVYHDVTDRLFFQAAYEEGEAFRNAVIETPLDEAILTTNARGVVQHWSRGASRLLGWAGSEISGKNIEVLYSEADRAEGLPDLERSRALSLGRAPVERQLLRRDGSLIWTTGELIGLRNPGGDVLGFLEIMRDPSAGRLLGKDVRDLEPRFETAAGSSDIIGSWDWEIRSDIVYADPNFARLHGVEQAEAETGPPIGRFLEAIHVSDRDAVNDAISDAVAKAGDYSIEYRLIQLDGSIRWVSARGRSYNDDRGRPLRFPGVLLDITTRKIVEARQAALIELGDRFRDAASRADIAAHAAELLAVTLNAARASFASIDAAGQGVSISRDWTDGSIESLAGVHRVEDLGQYGDALKRGETIVVSDASADTLADGATDPTFLGGGPFGAMIAVPIREGSRLAAILSVHEAHARHWENADVEFVRQVAERTWLAFSRAETEEQRALLASELQHRVKNTLAVVQAIAAQSFRNVSDQGAAAAFSERIGALARAHDILTQTNWQSAAIGDIVLSALSPYGRDGDRIRVVGPIVDLDAKKALLLALSINELATNAAKYGALSTPGGLVVVEWQVSQGRLSFAWSEHGGPTVAPPTRVGFGSRLVKRSLSAAFGAEIHLNFDASGLVCTFDAPLAE